LHDFDPRYFTGKWYQWHRRSSKDREDQLDLSDSESDSESDVGSESDVESDYMSHSETTVDSEGDPDYTYENVVCTGQHLDLLGIAMAPIHT